MPAASSRFDGAASHRSVLATHSKVNGLFYVRSLANGMGCFMAAGRHIWASIVMVATSCTNFTFALTLSTPISKALRSLSQYFFIFIFRRPLARFLPLKLRRSKRAIVWRRAWWTSTSDKLRSFPQSNDCPANLGSWP